MSFHQKFFYLLIFFLLGVAFASLTLDFNERVLFALCFGLILIVFFWIWKKQTVAILSVAFILGSQYCYLNDLNYQKAKIDLSDREFSGEVVELTELDRALEFDLYNPESRSKLRVYTDLLSGVEYMDKVLIKGELKGFSDENRRYFEKEGVHALASFPEVLILESGEGGLSGYLFSFRDRVQDSFESLFGESQATLMSGLILGKNVGLSDELKEKLSLTGTTHLIALSGYNITILATAVGSLLSLFFSRKASFLLSVLAIALFVSMTGAQASVVRAGVMGVILLLANQVSRVYSFKNALAFTAFVMVLFNPKILIFDLGFQLSFIALMGIVYLKPLLAYYLRLQGKGFFAWKDNLLTTISAQIAVAPLLLYSFGFISLIAVVTNVLILSVIPLTMLLGFLSFASSLFSFNFALIIAFFAQLLLNYELWIIDFFSSFPFQASIKLSVFWLLFAYLGIIFLIKRQKIFLYERE